MPAEDMRWTIGTCEPIQPYLVESYADSCLCLLFDFVQNSSGLCVCPVGHVLNKVTNSCISIDLCLTHQNGVCNVLRGALGGVGKVVAGIGASVDAAVDAALKVKIGA